MTAVVGRDDALARIERFLADGRHRYAALVLEGEPGIGKTTVWREAVQRGEEGGFRIVVSLPADAETKLAFAALADLVGAVEEDVLSELPEPQRNALDAALLRRHSETERIDPRAVAAALTSVLARLAQTSPLLVAIDDVQWLDRPSAAALGFALRRLDASSSVAVLVAVRLEASQRSDMLGLERLTVDRIERVRLGPLNLSALYHVIRTHLQAVFPRPTLQRIEQTSRGNPLFALEIARVLAEHGIPPVGEPLPVPSDVDSLLRRRVRKLPAATREVLLAAASLAEPRVETLRRALGRPPEDELGPAEDAGIVDCARGSVEFVHPLYASAIVASAAEVERRRMHKRLAGAVTDLEERARHLALATEGEDEAVAAVVDEAAGRALQRGAPTAAAELAELALRLTMPGSEEQPRRRLDLAKYLHASGEPERARITLESAGNVTSWSSNLRTEVLDLFALLGSYVDAPSALSEFFERALDEPLPPQARAAAHISISYSVQQIDAERALEHAEAGVALLESLGDEVDPEFAAGALATYARARLICGHGLDEELVRRAVELEARLPPERVLAEPVTIAFAYWFKWLDDFDRSREWLTRFLGEASGSGYDMFRAVALVHLSHTECLAGNLRLAHEHALSASRISDELEVPRLRVLAETALARVEAELGNAEEVRALGEQLDTSVAGGAGFDIDLDGILGLLELSAGNYAAADERLRNALARFEVARFAEPGQFRIHADAAEAAVVVGDLERAERIYGFLERHGRRTGRRWSLATGARVRASVAAAKGELDEALAAIEEALRWHVELPMPLEHGRTLLVKGVIERRLRRRRLAKASFEEALEIFADMGARLWEELARGELARLGLRRAAGDDLTEAERRVAELTARGLTRREVAARLFVSPKTVDATLARVYRKLGVRTRAELGARMVELVQR
jgi:DNA-binding CsgD family transcriptional regulator